MGDVSRGRTLAFCLLASPLLGWGQLRGQIPDRCPCSVQQELLVELGDPTDPDASLNTPWATVFELHGGSWATVDFQQPFALRIFSEVGEFEGSEGSEGDGPGEFRRIHEMVEWGDGYALYDSRTGRLSFLGADLGFTNSLAVGSLLRLVRVSDTVLVTNALYGPAAVEGHVVHVLDQTGRPAVSFGGDDLPLDLRPGNSAMHRLVTGSRDGGSVWVAMLGEFRLQRYDLSGKLLQTVDPSVDWFPGGSEPFTPHRTRMERPTPQISDIVQSAGLVWVLSYVADDNWADGVPQEYGESYDFNRVFDTRVDVYSEDRGEWVASARVDAALRKVGMAAEDGAIRVFNMRKEELGFWTAVVEELTLSPRIGG